MKPSRNLARQAVLLSIIAVLVLSGCGKSRPYLRSETYAKRDVRDVVREDVTYAVDISDPIEGWNRGVYRFNYYFDKYLFLPVVKTYEFVTPTLLQKAITNFFGNLADVLNLFNALLQLKPEASTIIAGRIFLNTTVGLGGIWDVATTQGVYKWKEDFGQTLGHYGVPPGPFLVLPILGPSNLRDTFGRGVDFVVWGYWPELDLLNRFTDNRYEVAIGIARAIDTRHITAFRYYETGSPFEYELVRMLYAKVREVEIAK